MKASQGILAALAGVFALCAQAREPNVSGLKSYTLPSYTIITHDERAAKLIVPQIASMERILSMLLKRKVSATGIPTYIYIVRSSLWIDYLEPGNAIVAEFVPGRFANHLMIGEVMDGAGSREGISHEFTHYFLHSQFRGACPLWFDEGLATLMQTARFEGGTATIGYPRGPPEYGNVPMATLLRIDKSSPEYLREPDSAGVHQQSWAMVHKGLIADPAFGAQMFAYLKAVDNLRPIDAAVVESFGMSVRELGKQINDYLDRNTVPVARLHFEPPPPAALGSGRDLSRLEALESLANLMFDSGFNPTRLVEVIDAAQRIAPNLDAVRVLRMRLAVRDRNDAALENLARGISPGTADPALARATGLALFERVREESDADPLSAAQRDALGARAFDLLDQSLAARPDDPEAAWGYGILAARRKQTPALAMRRLQRASELVPMNGDLAMAMALVCEADGQRNEMKTHLAETAQFSSSTEQRAWARIHLATVNRVSQETPSRE
jgi:hypothetical protein